MGKYFLQAQYLIDYMIGFCGLLGIFGALGLVYISSS